MPVAFPQFAFAVACLFVASLAAGQTEPKLPPVVRIVVPFSPGGSNDVIARVIAPSLAKRLGTTVVVDNKPGAGGVVGADAVAKSPADGSVLLLTSSSFLTATATLPKVPCDTLGSFTPVAMVAEGPLLLAVASSSPYKTPGELLGAARAKPGIVTYGSAGVGSVAQMATEMMNDAAKVKLLHVPYRGAANALIDLAAGQIDMMVTNYSTVVGRIKGGKIRPLGVTSRQANPRFPDLPPVSASAAGFAIDIWVGVFAPAGTPAALLQRLNREITDIATTPEMRAVLEPDGSLPNAMAAGAFATRVKDDLGLWKQIATDKKIVAE